MVSNVSIMRSPCPSGEKLKDTFHRNDLVPYVTCCRAPSRDVKFVTACDWDNIFFGRLGGKRTQYSNDQGLPTPISAQGVWKVTKPKLKRDSYVCVKFVLKVKGGSWAAKFSLGPVCIISLFPSKVGSTFIANNIFD